MACRLVLAPHMDDEVIGLGGTIAYLSSIGEKVLIAFLTDGGGNRQGHDREWYTRTRKEEARDAAKVLSGATNIKIVFLDLPDGQLSSHVDAAINQVTEIIERYKLRYIYAPSANEYHPDHRTANKVSKLSAWRAFFLKGISIDAIYEYEIYPPLKSYTDVLNITNSIEKKKLALQIYSKGTQKFIDPEAILAFNRYRAFWTIGEGYVEVFNSINLWKIRTLNEL